MWLSKQKDCLCITPGKKSYKRWLDPAKKFYRAEKKNRAYREKRKKIGLDGHYFSKDEPRKRWEI